MMMFGIVIWGLRRESRCLTVSCLVKPASQVGRGNHQAAGGEGGGGVEGLQVEGGQDGRANPASASQRSQAEVEREARAVAAAFMLFLSPALTDQLTVDVLTQGHPGTSER